MAEFCFRLGTGKSKRGGGKGILFISVHDVIRLFLLISCFDRLIDWSSTGFLISCLSHGLFFSFFHLQKAVLECPMFGSFFWTGSHVQLIHVGWMTGSLVSPDSSWGRILFRIFIEDIPRKRFLSPRWHELFFFSLSRLLFPIFQCPPPPP